ncbi:amino acid transporter heavy chain SLC3A1 isoform X2 [Anabrus simplex]|uniref:amino acid transporter heavy chain SLC3A1 isoform X2 n=1 Tax=Anabrus simplex TaxID=316456 RepID=UPI0035A2A0BA
MPEEGYVATATDGSSFGSAAGLTKDQLLECAYRPLWVWLRGTLITAYWLAWLIMLVTAVVIIKNAPKCNSPQPLEWWQRSPIYQVQVESFSDGGDPVNGQGDIAGLENRLDYIEKLGVRTVCLSSIFDSPLKDPSSVIDFKNVAPQFGTLEDFMKLVKKIQEKDMRLVLDFIPNHTSNKHQWFQKSVRREDPYTYYYVWRGAGGESSNGEPLPPNDCLSENGESAWEWNEERKEFYFHQFSRDQPDLNYRSPELLQEMKDILSLWLQRGVNGFRLKDVSHLVEDDTFNNYTFNNVEGFDILQEFREVMDNNSVYETKVLLVEDDIPLDALPLYYGNTSKPLAHLAISTKFSTNIESNITAIEMFNNVQMWLDILPGTAWPNWMVGDKDVNRLASRVGPSLADAINMIILLLPGTPLTYYGDEIGMEDVNDTQDTLSTHSKEVSYSPMQWNADKHAGFSSANHTWIPVNGNYPTVNVEMEERADWSHMKLYRALVESRSTEAVMNGETELKLLGDHVFTYTRSKISNRAVFFPGRGGVVLTFVPNFPIDS